jgi:RHS repeat-associated protein
LNSDLPDVLSDGTNLYIPGIGQAAMDGSAPEFYLTDANGSTRLITDASGAVVGNPQNYDPFGNTGEPPSSPVGYSGEWKDASGLIYLRARYYDPSTGTFISKDPLSGNITDPATMNGYNYADDNPIMGSDPSGECDVLGFAISRNFNTFVKSCEIDNKLALIAKKHGADQRTISFIEGGGTESAIYASYALNLASNVTKSVGMQGMELSQEMGDSCPATRLEATGQILLDEFLGFGIVQTPLTMIANGDANAIASYADEGNEWAEILSPESQINEFDLFTDADWEELSTQEAGSDTFGYVSRQASKWQLRQGLNSDHWQDITIPAGSYVWGGEPGQSNFYTSDETIQMTGNDATKIFKGLQNPIPVPHTTFRAGMTKYLVTQDITVATSFATENTFNGNFPGGLLQYFIPGYDQYLEPVETMLLKNRGG